jgi:drug/metabolite transporter (DMT)-like permease
MIPDARQSMSALEWLLLVILSVLWGGSFYFNAVLVSALPPLTIVFGRVALAASVLLLVACATGHPIPRAAPAWRALAGLAILNNLLPFTLIVWGQSHVPSGLAAILNANTPLFAVILAYLLTKDEPLRSHRLTGVALGIAGVTVMVGPAALQGLGTNLLAQIAVLGAAFSYALAGVYSRRFQVLGLTPLSIAIGQVICSAALIFPIMLFVDRPWTLAAPDGRIVLALLGLGVLSTAAGYVLYFRILTGAGATNATLVTLLIPVSAVLLGSAFLGEQLAMEQIAGMALVTAGLVASDGRLLLWLAKRFTAREAVSTGQDRRA